ncbi:uncharacterized protein LOC123678054 [Harmonia axyridis]|uniref:uncharacterized protein LOC123678054 n=1 Tax=Harmonia axyridis TaxID=115357 RepID=UPI001E279B0A|nr:uncharacterized protein LOC123678054 [Harmonia axyridis]
MKIIEPSKNFYFEKMLSGDDEVVVPECIIQEANEAAEAVIPLKSKILYEKQYTAFCAWRNNKKAKGVNEKIILAYISEQSKKVKSSSLWSYYSQLKKMLALKEKIDIGRFHQVTAFLKQHSRGYVAKKSKVFTREEFEYFLDAAPDEQYLLIKVVFIMGVAGGCRIGELVTMTVDDVEDRGSVLVIQIPDTKTYKKRVFTVVNGTNKVAALDIFRKYRNLRPSKVDHKRLFINYKNEKCTVQPVGVNTFSKMPVTIAKYLGLSDAEQYTGHSFRRSSATLLANSGADLTVLKRHGGWRSSSVAEGYIEDSLQNKINISEQILGGVTKTGVPDAEMDIPAGPEKSSNTCAITTERVSFGGGAGFQFHFQNLSNCNFYFNDRNDC